MEKKNKNKVIKRLTTSGQVITYTVVKSSKKIEPPKEKLARANARLAEMAELNITYPEGFPPLKKRRVRKGKK